MIKLLVNTPSGVQEVIEVRQGGTYFDESLVVWDERVDGPLPNTEPGGLTKSEGSLVFSQQRLDAHNVAIQPSRQDLKQQRSRMVGDIKVTVAGKEFDGDEVSQERMTRALKVAEITGLTSTMWTLADNSRVEVTIEELSQALSLAALEQAELWEI